MDTCANLNLIINKKSKMAVETKKKQKKTEINFCLQKHVQITCVDVLDSRTANTAYDFTFYFIILDILLLLFHRMSS